MAMGDLDIRTTVSGTGEEVCRFDFTGATGLGTLTPEAIRNGSYLYNTNLGETYTWTSGTGSWAEPEERACTCFEDHDLITAGEFREFVTQLIRGKKGALPDVDDWREIKQMMDRIYDPDLCNCFEDDTEEEDCCVDNPFLADEKIVSLADEISQRLSYELATKMDDALTSELYPVGFTTESVTSVLSTATCQPDTAGEITSSMVTINASDLQNLT